MATSTDVGNPTPMATPTMNEHRVENSQPNQGRTPLSSYSPAAQRVGLAPLPPIKSITMWQGTLTWVEMSTVGKEVEMSTYVMAGTAHHQYTFVETWPQTMRIVPTNEPVAAMADIHLWLQRHRPAFCTFRAQPRAVSDPVLNQQNFKTLVRLLGMKNVQHGPFLLVNYAMLRSSS
ncbi:hypothetical protein BDZ94DRAFT_573836 [Collybia nuda]|uniref:Uncharacterized protein n=1 Tax=Collybia nuda TaxID=64659 RepID=A0A9P6CFD7_9AGAR|nr:hypothetical protein BDZ94DRAFT_573836 [Collybia nuda]